MILLGMPPAPPVTATAPASVAAMRWHKRVLLISASDADDPRLVEQRGMLRAWRTGAEDRDLVVIEILGERVIGTGDGADALRRRYRLPASGFGVALVGKDGGVKLRRSRPVDAPMLAETIDAMPMRRAGGR
ncbi:DUF4174 domain-containing protein [Sphingomonas sp. GV3]|uniref:DUF4174 domain-containing protein n=1 Tax=Sphingomonas sp. GV3 TaxID=3040671 RepID=UPI00280AE0FE|nr:DUF4174 domain-containing protein [Sphingomonas sp. GV3]